MHLVLSLVVFLLNIKRKTYSNVKHYFPSIVYVMFFNSLYYYLFKHFLLWEFRSPVIKVKYLRGLYIFFIMPHVILLYLSEFPSLWYKQLIHIVKWIAVSAAIEFFLFHRNKFITFHHNWSIFWSVCVYIKMYLFSYLLLKRPLAIINASIASVVCALLVFKPPLSKGFYEGPLLKRIKGVTTYRIRKKNPLLRVGD
ncbi:CBO0543 family protein [Halalkalibacter okhensis]|uniref:Uncharacterized protein n=1 Tax=Halalkalibacter okhensis TaxID=333138 RepID=A0A0B0IFD9_9BACI|nr:CBO0543 family protein [Halalkalibacter okhensis]KHF40025.1 hypothetical protein LQ50_12120 [Halalkalibacter okhensis]